MGGRPSYRIDAGRPEDVIKAIKRLSSLFGSDKEICEREIGYFDRNKERMRYGDYEGVVSLLAPEFWRPDAVPSLDND